MTTFDDASSRTTAAGKWRSAAVRDVLSRHPGVIESIPLFPNGCAATMDGRREGLVRDDFAEEGKDDDYDFGDSWMECDAADALLGGGGGGGGCDDVDDDARYEVCMGLKFYHDDPLPRLMRYCAAASGGRRYVDGEFPVHPGMSVSLPDVGRVGGGGGEGEGMEGGGDIVLRRSYDRAYSRRRTVATSHRAGAPRGYDGYPTSHRGGACGRGSAHRP